MARQCESYLSGWRVGTTAFGVLHQDNMWITITAPTCGGNVRSRTHVDVDTHKKSIQTCTVDCNGKEIFNSKTPNATLSIGRFIVGITYAEDTVRDHPTFRERFTYLHQSGRELVLSDPNKIMAQRSS